MASMHTHQIKINRAIRMADTGRYPSTCSAMLAHIPDDVIAECPARIIAQLLDSMWAACREAKRIKERDILQEGAIWDGTRHREITN